MYLEQLSKSEDFAAWRKEWNDRVLPFLDSLRPVAGPGIRIDRKDNGSLFRAVPVASRPGGTGGNSYNSYFKLSLALEDGIEVTIADGATGQTSLARVNGYTSYQMPPYTETVTADRLFYLKYTPARYGTGGGLISAAAMEYGSVGRDEYDRLILPESGADGAVYFQLGRVVFSGGAPSVIQDHTSGVADIRWYMNCR